MFQDPELLSFLSKARSLILSPSSPASLRQRQPFEILSLLRSRPSLNPLPLFLGSNVLPPLFGLKGYDRDYEILEILEILVKSASKMSLQGLLRLKTLDFVISFIPHRKKKVLKAAAVVMARLAGGAVGAREEIIRNGDLTVMVRLLGREKDAETALVLSYLVYKCSKNVSPGFMSLLSTAFEYIRYLLNSDSTGTTLGNCYEALHNVAENSQNDGFIRKFKGIELDFLLSLPRCLPNTPSYTSEFSTLSGFMRVLADFLRVYPPEFIETGINLCVFDRLAVFLFDDSLSAQKQMISVFSQIYRKGLGPKAARHFFQLKGMGKWLAKELKRDRKDKFGLCLEILYNALSHPPFKSLPKIAKLLLVLMECYELLVSREKRLQILAILGLFVQFLAENQAQNSDLIRDFVFGLAWVSKIQREDQEEARVLAGFAGFVRGVIQN